MSAGDFLTLAVSEAGATFSWGDNASGQTGHGVAVDAVRVPTQVEALRSVREMHQAVFSSQ